jgi:hypothetical protein
MTHQFYVPVYSFIEHDETSETAGMLVHKKLKLKREKYMLWCRSQLK